MQELKYQVKIQPHSIAEGNTDVYRVRELPNGWILTGLGDSILIQYPGLIRLTESARSIIRLARQDLKIHRTPRRSAKTR